ncbi:MAG TPA: hypothetical protein HA263_11745 [Methanoregulaceae archaeon]|nr:hypothetical protein [Methanoregulaceae archaeon]
MRPLVLLLLLGPFALPAVAVSGTELSGDDLVSRSEPPVLLGTLEVHGYTVTIGGTIEAGPESTISRIAWDWGDGVVEDHAIPNIHTYTRSGTYTVEMAAYLSDGRSGRANLSNIFVAAPGTTPTPVSMTVPPTPPVTGPAPSPVILLNSPKVAGPTVVIEGVAMPGGSGAAIDLIAWDWGDGTLEIQSPFPAINTYAAPGGYMVRVEVSQSDGGAPEARSTSTASVPVGIGVSVIDGPTPTAISVTPKATRPSFGFGRRYAVGNPGAFLGARTGAGGAPTGPGGTRKIEGSDGIVEPEGRGYGITLPKGQFVRWYPGARWRAGVE